MDDQESDSIKGPAKAATDQPTGPADLAEAMPAPPPGVEAPTSPPLPPSPAAGGQREGGRARPPWFAWLAPLALLGILLLGAALRFPETRILQPDQPRSQHDQEALILPLWGNGPSLAFYPWDEGLSLHPDERFLTMVALAIAIPEPCRSFLPHLRGGETAPPRGDLASCFSAYLDSSTSSLNPRNQGHSLWVYGSLPMTLFRAAMESLDITGFSQTTTAGRIFSALTDLVIILLTYFLGKRLYGVRAGLLAALFLSLSVLSIQNAHFFTVDIVTTLASLLCVYLTVVLAEGKGRWGTFALLGLSFGVAVSCKINMASFALIIALAGLVRVWRRAREGGNQALGPALRNTALGLLLVAVLSLVTFRLAQPDAFTGPGFFDVKPELRFLENLGTIQGLISGEVDYYPSHQWTERPALWFPWSNMVIWGLGLPLGLAAWAGVAVAGWKLVRRRDLRPIVPLAWTLLLFLYQGVQFVKTMRYFLPIYPLLCIFAAYLLGWLWDCARAREPRPKWRTVVAGALLGLVAVGTFLWAWGFIQIYRKPITRAAASRWIYQNIPTNRGAWLSLGDGTQVTIPIPNAYTYEAGRPATTTAFSVTVSGTATQLTVAHLQEPGGNPGVEQLRVIISADPAGQQAVAQGVVTGDFSGPAADGAPGIVTFDPIALEANRTYYLRLQGLQGSIRTWAVALANEAWDDAVPMRVDGKDGFSIYRGLMMQPYGEDTPEKVEELLHQLANTDYVCLTSNRLYDSIPRLPMRYPATTRYYRALFDGSLGFERVATFTSFPTLFAAAVPPDIAAKSDEERAATVKGWYGLPIPDQGAEEAFSVYDHPKVQIFRRTAAFDIDRARTLLTAGIDWDTIARIRPIEVPVYRWRTTLGLNPAETKPRATDLMLTNQEQQVQSQGGTWSEIFPPDGWPSKIALPLWLLVVELLGLAAWPLANSLLGRLSDGGYLPAKALGFLLMGYLSWLLAASKVLPYTRWTILLVLFLLLVLGGVVGWFRRKELLALWQTRRKLLLLEEGIFLGAFLLFLIIRLGNPDVWHPWFGGEKPMDLAYLTAIVRSTTFPPYDPWFSGGYLNYYYFGWVLLAAPIKLTGIVPGVAFNLAIPLLYGLTCGGAFTVVYHLVNRGKREGDGWERPAIVGGLAGVAFVALLGNLGEFSLIMGKLAELSDLKFTSNIPGLAGLVKALAGLPKALQGGLPVGTGSWYWDASRIIVQHPGDPVRGNEINEFPFFSFLYADLHPHLMAMPFTLLALTQVIAMVQDRERTERSILALLPRPWALLGLALVLATLRAANFWDLPIYLLIALGGWAVALYEKRRRIDWQMLVGVGLLGVILYLLSSYLLAPFWSRYGMLYNSVVPWTGERTRVWEFAAINGLALFILVSYLLIESFGRGAREGPLHLVGLTLRFWDRLPTLTRRLRRWDTTRNGAERSAAPPQDTGLGGTPQDAGPGESPEGAGERSEPAPQGAALSGAKQSSAQPQRWRLPALPTLLWGGLALLLIELYFFLPVSQGTGEAASSDKFSALTFLLHMRGQVLVGVVILLGVLGVVLFFRRRRSPEERLIAMLVVAGLGISAGVELVVIKGDVARQNTFFKFYLQTWILWGVATAAMLPRLWQRMRGWTRGARNRWRALLFILIGVCALYPLLATPAKIKDRFPGTMQGPGLDGEAFMQTDVYQDEHGPIILAADAAAMDWLRANVQGTPVILEAASGLDNVNLYRWGSRFSIHTGLPTVLGWDWHQTQQRRGEGVQPRLHDVTELYNSTDIARTVELLRKYRVSYIVVGQVEHYYYAAEGLAKFDQMVGIYLERVYAAGSPPQEQGASSEVTVEGSPATLPAEIDGYPSPEGDYPQATPPPLSPPSSPTAAPTPGGTVIYRVLPSVWGP